MIKKQRPYLYQNKQYMVSKAYIKIIAVFITAILVMAPAMKAQSTIKGKTLAGGYIEGEQTWTLAESPFVVVEDIVITEGSKLIIEPGVIIGIRDGLHLYVDGTLDINGDQEDPVILTAQHSIANPSPDTSFWGGIVIRGSKASLTARFMIGYFAESLFTFDSYTTEKVEIIHSYFRANKAVFECLNMGDQLLITNNQIYKNEFGFVFYNPVPPKRIFHNRITRSHTSDLINLSGKQIGLNQNCWENKIEEEASKDQEGAYPNVAGSKVIILPAGQFCGPITDLFLKSGGDITVVLDDDLVGTPIEIVKNVDISVFPNPTLNQLKITYRNISPESLRIINSVGQVVGLYTELPRNEIDIFLGHLSAGIYHLQLNTKTGVMQTRVVVMEN